VEVSGMPQPCSSERGPTLTFRSGTSLPCDRLTGYAGGLDVLPREVVDAADGWPAAE
jgi:hypothetical protein